MKCITIQHKSVLDTLVKTGIYQKNIKDSKSRESAYRFMKNFYRYKNPPIFLAPVGYHVEFYGISLEDAVAIELEIPRKVCKIQKYYDWSDFLYFLQFPDEFESDVFKNDVFKFGEYVLSDSKRLNKKDVFQVSTDILRKEWVIGYSTNLKPILESHYESGGNHILSELK